MASPQETWRAYRYTVVLDWDEEGQGFAVSVPALPGCFTQGDTREEALANAREAIECYLLGLLDDGLPIPESDVETETVQVRIPV